MQVVHNHLNKLVNIFIRTLPADQPGGKLLKCVEERIQVHLTVVTLPHDILVNYVIVSFKQAGISETRNLAELLELHGRDGIGAFLTCQVLEYALSMRINVKLVKLGAIVWQNSLQTAHGLDEVGLLLILAWGWFGAYQLEGI